jgi:hypothetical protein
MYVLPKGLESAWTSARGRGWVFKTGNYGDSIVSDDFEYSFLFSPPVGSDLATSSVSADGDWNGYGHGQSFVYTGSQLTKP